jgi:hypothetical protein
MPTDKCEKEQQAVDALTGLIAALQDSLQDANPGDKPKIIAKIDAAEAKLSLAEEKLAECRAATNPPALPNIQVAWPANVTGWLRGSFKGRASAKVDLVLSYFNNRTEFRLDPFTIDTKVSGVAITLQVATPNSGTVFDPDAHGFRDMVIAVRVGGSAAGVGIPAADLSLDTSATFDVPEAGTIRGSAMNGVGFLGMIGFADLAALGFTARLYLQVEGILKPPLPWGFK